MRERSGRRQPSSVACRPQSTAAKLEIGWKLIPLRSNARRGQAGSFRFMTHIESEPADDSADEPLRVLTRIMDIVFGRFGSTDVSIMIHGGIEALFSVIKAGNLSDAATGPADSAGLPTAEKFAAGVSQVLEHRPVLAIPPWGSSAHGRMPETEWLSSLDMTSDHVLGVLLPASMLSGRRVGHLWGSTPAGAKPIAMVTGREWLPGLHRTFELALVLLAKDSDEPTRFFRVPSHIAMDEWSDDLERLMRRAGGQGKFGFVERDPIAIGEPLTFERHDPTSKSRQRDLSAFGTSVVLGDAFKVLKSFGKFAPAVWRKPTLQITWRL